MNNQDLYQDIIPEGPKDPRVTAIYQLHCITVMFFFIAFTYYIFVRLPLWGDEYFTYKVLQMPFREGIRAILNDVHPPLFWILFYPAFAGVKDLIIIRSFTMLFGFLALFYAGSIAGAHEREDIHAKDTMLVSFSLIAFTSPFIFLFMPMLRYYSLFALLTAYSLLLKYILKGKWLSIIEIIIVDTLLLYTSFIGGLILVGSNIYLLSRKKLQFSKVQHILIWVLPWLFFSPIIGYFTRAITKLSTQDIFKADFGAGLKGFIVRILYSLHVFISGEFVYPWQPSGIIMFALAVYLIYRFIRYGPSELKSLIGWGILMPALLTIIGSVTLFSLGMEFLPPRIAFAQPFLLLALAIGLKTIQSKKLYIALLILFVLGNLHADYNLAVRKNFLHSTYIIPWQRILDEIDSKFKGGDVIVYDDESFMYYLEKDSYAIRSANVSSIELSNITVYNRIWVVFSPKDITPNHKMQDFLDGLEKSGYTEVEHKYYLEEKESARRIKEKLLGRPVSRYKKELILFESP